MYVNGKMRSAATVAGIQKRGIKEKEEGVNSTLTYCMNICKCHSLLPS
jgi:hypothetical protein